MIAWMILVGCVAAAPDPPTEAAAAADTEAASSTFVLDGGDEERLSLAASAARVSQAPPSATGPRPRAYEYSDGYRIRRKVHKYASFATLPLFVAQFAVGQKLYDGSASDATRAAHGALAAGTGVLFGVNTVTGAWNLAEGRKDPNHRRKRMVHGILMFAADAGFVATGLLAPESEREGRFGRNEGGGNRSTHRAVALASMGVATVSYLIMLLGD